MKIDTLRAKLAEHSGTMAALAAAAEAENRPMSDQEAQQFDIEDSAVKSCEAEIARLERLEALAAKASVPQPRKTEDAPARVTGGTLAAHNFANHGFRQVGEFFQAVRKVATTNIVDPRLITNAVSTYGSEGTNADGGFALPPQFVNGIMDAVMPQDSFLAALNPVYTNSSLLVVPVNENPAWSASGITAAKTAEGAATTQSKPAIRQVNVVLHKIAAMVSVSDEAIDDMPFLASWVMQQMAEHIRYKMENYVVNGTGMNEPLGFYYAPGLKTVSDGDSTATMLGRFDAMTMEAGCLPGQGTFWLAGPTVLPAVASMNTGTGGFPLFAPDATVAPKRTLLGRPYYVSEALKAWNTLGDLYVVNPNGYILALKSNGVQTASTIAFAFDQNLTSYRATVRMGGAPLLSAVVTRGDGSSTASHIVTIAGSRS